MKYTVYDASQYIKVGETNSEVEALKMRDQFIESSPASDCVIEDEEGNYFDLDWDLATFVTEIIDHDDSGDLKPITTKEALRNMMEWFKEGVEIPEDMTPEILSYYWNDAIETMEAEKAAKAAAEIKAQDDFTRENHPDWLEFPKAYESGASLWIDPDWFSNDLRKLGYDEKHREIIAKALMAYQKQCQEA